MNRFQNTLWLIPFVFNIRILLFSFLESRNFINHNQIIKNTSMMERSKLFMLAATMLLGLSFNVQAQEEEVTDEELRSYAVVMDSAEVKKKEMGASYNKMIQEEEAMQGGRRFQELKNANGDEEKLEEIGATEEEIEIYTRIQEDYDAMVNEFKEEYTEMIKEHVTVPTYNKVSRELKSNEEVKARYEEILSEVQEEREAMESEEEETEETTDEVGAETSK